MIRATRAADGCRPLPVLTNEADLFRFSDPGNHLLAALGLHLSWGYFDPGNSDYAHGYQCLPPVNWQINTPRKKVISAKLKEITGVWPPAALGG
jgi:hypothetical protein